MFGKTNIRFVKKVGYVTDGLILHLDGINWGNQEGKWIDLVNNIDFLTTGTVQRTNNSFICNAGGFYYNGSFTDVVHIEVVFKSTTRAYQSIFATPTVDKRVVLNYTSNKIIIQYGGNKNNCVSFVIPDNKLISISSNYQTAYINGILSQQSNVRDDWTRTLNDTRIGTYALNSPYYLQGEICSIRLYNRALTADETSRNFAVDKARFNIPD